MTTPYEHLMDDSYDEHLQRAHEEGLTWLPWVGRDFRDSVHRFLIVAESHYSNQKDNTQAELDLVSANGDETRMVVGEYPVCNGWGITNRMFDNLHRLLLAATTRDIPFETRKELWSVLAFYNFIQRPMNYAGQIKERPRRQEFVDGWRHFVNVARILRPKYCLFVGITAANVFNEAMSAMGIEHQQVEIIGKVNGYRMLAAELTLDGQRTRILFIRHTSSYFSWPSWREKFLSLWPDVLAGLPGSPENKQFFKEAAARFSCIQAHQS